tara:strand:- start:616 stop:840 length:225 start_codon:yes stop_codon:yes gene_type:complete
MPRIFFHRIKCIGCNACVEAAPGRWRVSRNDGRCFLIGGVEKRGIYRTTIEEHELEENLVAAANCPVKIIKVER